MLTSVRLDQTVEALLENLSRATGRSKLSIYVN